MEEKMATNTTNTTSTERNGCGKCRILALYQFVSDHFTSEELESLKCEVETVCREHGARGTLLLAPEGINGTICYPFQTPQATIAEDDEKSDPILSFLRIKFPPLRIRLSSNASGHVFYRFKVKVKPEIITCHGLDMVLPNGTSIDPSRKVGTYVPPGPQWDNLLNDPDCLVIDARNDYEFRVGTFRNAVNPVTQNFSELVPWMQKQVEPSATTGAPPKKIAMFCTGGIRCEKASAVCMEMCNLPVYHLEGGILAYLDKVPKETSQFEGECYVFDQRVAVSHGLTPTTQFTMCHACRAPLSVSEREGHPDFELGRSCRYCKDATTLKQRLRYESRQKQIKLAQEKGLLHIHDPKEKVLAVLGGTHLEKAA